MTPRTTTTGIEAGPSRVLLAGALVLAAAVTALVVLAVGSVDRVPWSGLAARDVAVSWLLPGARVVTDVSAAATVGCLVAAALLLPGTGVLSAAGYRWLRRATWPAVAWAVAAALAVPGLLVEFLNTDLAGISPRAAVAFVRDTPAGAAQATAVALAATVAVGSRLVLTTAGARALLVLAVLAVVPPAVAEYAEAEGTTGQVAIAAAGMAVHAVGALVWAGTLAALLLVRLPAADLGTAVRRYSRLAPVLVLAVGASGLVTAAAELDRLDRWPGTDYGRLVLLKILALGALAGIGWWHRRRTLAALAEGRTGAFRRVAAVELLVFAATVGLAVGLSRTPPPALEDAVEQEHAAPAAAGSAERVLTGAGLHRPVEA